MAKKSTKLPVEKPSSSYPISAAPYKPTKADVDRERRYKAEDALRTLTQASEYQKDKGLMKDVKALAKEQMNKLKNI